ncbi:unnamed protein product [Caenorhabditis auriculariae]|uniref:Uncharacterized protein n=1 Tax=Caenorhabditis auriculariae TaxID=2777116 RepID=A0A8S1GYG8_9PELO|nr:unnamed protein product [Caenorhabditis auriculariae]
MTSAQDPTSFEEAMDLLEALKGLSRRVGDLGEVIAELIDEGIQKSELTSFFGEYLTKRALGPLERSLELDVQMNQLEIELPWLQKQLEEAKKSHVKATEHYNDAMRAKREQEAAERAANLAAKLEEVEKAAKDKAAKEMADFVKRNEPLRSCKESVTREYDEPRFEITNFSSNDTVDLEETSPKKARNRRRSRSLIHSIRKKATNVRRSLSRCARKIFQDETDNN